MIAVVGKLLRRGVESRKSLACLVGLVGCAAMGISRAAYTSEQAAGEVIFALVPLLFVPAIAAHAMSLAVSHLAKRPRIRGAAVAGLAFSLTLAPETAVVPATIALVCGWIASQEVFGSRERSFVHPAVLGHVFLALTWPKALGGAQGWLPAGEVPLPSWHDLFALQLPNASLGASSSLACLIGAVLLVVLARASWRVLAAVPIGMAAGLGMLGGDAAPGLTVSLSAHLLLGNAMFAVVFLATDSVSSPERNSSRWVYGVVIGFLIILQRLAKPSSPDGVIFAILVASVFSPLIDRVAAAGQARWQRREHG